MLTVKKIIYIKVIVTRFEFRSFKLKELSFFDFLNLGKEISNNEHLINDTEI